MVRPGFLPAASRTPARLPAVLHMAQCARSGRFQMLDYGSATANMEVYGSPRPPDVAAQYWRLGGWAVPLHGCVAATVHSQWTVSLARNVLTTHRMLIMPGQSCI
jgi:hypothetical protein